MHAIGCANGFHKIQVQASEHITKDPNDKSKIQQQTITIQATYLFIYGTCNCQKCRETTKETTKNHFFPFFFLLSFCFEVFMFKHADLIVMRLIFRKVANNNNNAQIGKEKTLQFFHNSGNVFVEKSKQKLK